MATTLSKNITGGSRKSVVFNISYFGFLMQKELKYKWLGFLKHNLFKKWENSLWFSQLVILKYNLAALAEKIKETYPMDNLNDVRHAGAKEAYDLCMEYSDEVVEVNFPPRAGQLAELEGGIEINEASTGNRRLKIFLIALALLVINGLVLFYYANQMHKHPEKFPLYQMF